VIELQSHAGDAEPAGIGHLSPANGSFSREDHLTRAKVKLELQLGANRARLAGADEDAALADVDGVSIDKLPDVAESKPHLKRDRPAF
jgi:hypothetical protein